MKKSLVVLLAAFALLASGCFMHMTGGGWIYGESGEKSNFGFNVQCSDDGAKGHITFHDPGYDLKIKGTVTGCFLGYVTGTYVPQGKTDAAWTGEFKIEGDDFGEPGVFDRITIKLYQGSIDWSPDYSVKNAVLMGGNIQDH